MKKRQVVNLFCNVNEGAQQRRMRFIACRKIWNVERSVLEMTFLDASRKYSFDQVVGFWRMYWQRLQW